MSDTPGDVLKLPNGRRVGYLVRGPDDGTTVVWVHGWPGSRLEQLTVSDESLARHGVRLIAVDRPGYGETDPLAGTRAERMADVLGVCDELGVITFAAIGVSCGGSNVVALAASAPDRVSRLVLVSAQMPYDDESVLSELAADQLEDLPVLRQGRTPEYMADEEKYRQGLLENGVKAIVDPADFSIAEQRWLAVPRIWEALDADVLEAARLTSEGLAEDGLMCVKPLEFDMSEVKCPVFAVHGTEDDWEPIANLRRFLDQLPEYQLILLEGLGHLGPHLYADLLLSLAVGREFDS
jgi:pimeloyl-ACP methyl ester carboxylesterase